jgi:hypothetical protein
MTYGNDFRWRAVALHHIYGLPIEVISEVLGPRPRTVRRWYQLFLNSGTVNEGLQRQKTSRWPPDVLLEVERYAHEHPTFYIDELKSFIEHKFPLLENTSTSTICRALNFDLNLTRKILTKAAREAVPVEIENYKKKMEKIYSYPEQILFIDETSKDGRHARMVI